MCVFQFEKFLSNTHTHIHTRVTVFTEVVQAGILWNHHKCILSKIPMSLIINMMDTLNIKINLSNFPAFVLYRRSSNLKNKRNSTTNKTNKQEEMFYSLKKIMSSPTMKTNSVATCIKKQQPSIDKH